MVGVVTVPAPRRVLMRLLATLAAALLLAATPAARASAEPQHGLAMHGDLKYPPTFKHFDYVEPGAPKGGSVRLAAVGTFDTLNPYILKGTAAAGIGLTFETLMEPSSDEAFSMYGLIAESAEMPPDRAWVAFHLRAIARWHDGSPIEPEDVIFSLETLKTKGHPFYRAYYKDVTKVEKTGTRTVRFTFAPGVNRELPLIIGNGLPILPRKYFQGREFEQTTLEPILASGPYRVATVDAGRSIAFARVPDYWGRDLPVNVGRHNFGEMRYEYYRDSNVAIEALKARQFDFRQENQAKTWATAYDIAQVKDGRMVKEEIGHELPTGMQAFAFNLRRDKFQDRRVRQALGYAFDFEWTNKNLFFGQYTRTRSFFSNSELASSGLPSKEELVLLEPFRKQLPEEVFVREYVPPATDGSGNNREQLREARRLLEEAGWKVKDGKLAGPKGEPMAIEFLIAEQAFERIIAPVKQNLGRLGIEASIRVVDTAQFQRRSDTFDFDVVVETFGQSLSPGNEQHDFWSSEVADVEGSRNTIGIGDPVVDALVAKVIAAPTRPELITATRALDRVLLWGHYLIPQFHIRTFRLIYWNRFGRPARVPKYSLGFDGWWVDAARDQALARGEGTAR
ncbi:MAG: ABC transporter substrate-binding protein [Alphaproteobacteria bacterium]|nr:ABC transporter substrate-binding protein [Alphaproteobacteria bacterium]